METIMTSQRTTSSPIFSIDAWRPGRMAVRNISAYLEWPVMCAVNHRRKPLQISRHAHGPRFTIPKIDNKVSGPAPRDCSERVPGRVPGAVSDDWDFAARSVFYRNRTDGQQEQPDEALRPKNTRQYASCFPTLVVEVGRSESLGQLRNDAHFWLTHTDREVRVVILIHIHANNRKLHLERWELLQRNLSRTRQSAKLTKLQELDLCLLNDGTVSVNPASATLDITTQSLFDIVPPGVTNDMITIGANELLAFAYEYFTISKWICRHKQNSWPVAVLSTLRERHGISTTSYSPSTKNWLISNGKAGGIFFSFFLSCGSLLCSLVFIFQFFSFSGFYCLFSLQLRFCCFSSGSGSFEGDFKFLKASYYSISLTVPDNVTSPQKRLHSYLILPCTAIVLQKHLEGQDRPKWGIKNIESIDHFIEQTSPFFFLYIFSCLLYPYINTTTTWKQKTTILPKLFFTLLYLVIGLVYVSNVTEQVKRYDEHPQHPLEIRQDMSVAVPEYGNQNLWSGFVTFAQDVKLEKEYIALALPREPVSWCARTGTSDRPSWPP